MKVKYLSLILLTLVISFIASCSVEDNMNNTEGTELYRIQVGGKYGFINEKGKLVIEPQYDEAFPFFNEGFCYAKNGERKGVINVNGDFVTELDTAITWVFPFTKGVAVYIAENGKLGIITNLGDNILPAIYKNIWIDGNHGFIVEDTLEKRGYVNYLGEFIVPCKYDAVNEFHEGLMVVATRDKCGYVDTTGTWVIDSIYDDARGFGDGLARVKIKDKWMFIDHSGKVVDRYNYDEILSGFACNRAFVRKGKSIELIDTLGSTIAEINADSVYGFQNGYATFKKNGRYGMLDTMGVITIRPKFEKIGNVVDSLSVFERNGKQGVINTSGDIVVEATNIAILNADTLSLLVCANISGNEDLLSYYDKSGNLVWKDMSGGLFTLPEKPTKSDFRAYFDSRLSELDPIEGIYYVTWNFVAMNSRGDCIPISSESSFLAVMRIPNTDEFWGQFIDGKSPWNYWVKEFVHIGESNTYAVINNNAVIINQGKTKGEDGKLILDDPYRFEILLKQGIDNYYNYYNRCEFIKDYPSATEYEQVQKAEWSGTGFAIANGYVVTNYHVTTGAKTIFIKGVNGDIEESYKGYVVDSDREHDLAIIKIIDKKFEGFDEIPYCIGKTMPEVGDDVFVLGYPLTETMGKDIKLTDGIISASSGYKGDQSMYQISAAVQPGNSGGPLFDKEGNVIGVVCAKHADAENANYAIKVSYLFSLINSSDLGIKLPEHNNIKSKSLSKKVKIVKPFVYLIECSSH